MKILVTVLFCVGSAHANATFTSAKSGNWNDPTTWGFGAGACAYHSTCPAMTHGGDAGDLVRLGNLAHTVTCPAGVTCSAGQSSSTATALAISAVSLTNTTASLDIAGTLIYAGSVQQNNKPWVLEAGGRIQHDASYSAAPTTAHYTWDAGSGGITINGTVGSRAIWDGAGNSASNGACNSFACRSGHIIINTGAKPTFSHVTFQHLGPNTAPSSDYSIATVTLNNPLTFTDVIMDDFDAWWFEVSSGGIGGIAIDGLQIKNPINNGASDNAVFLFSAPPGVGVAPRTITNSVIEGMFAEHNSPPVGGWIGTTNGITVQNLVCRGNGGGACFRAIQASMPTDQVMIWTSALASLPGAGLHSSWSIGGYVNAGAGCIDPVLGTAVDATFAGATFEANYNTTSCTFLTPPNVPTSHSFIARNNVMTPGPSGAGPSPFAVSFGTSGGTYEFHHNTVSTSAADGFLGAEFDHVLAGAVVRLDSNLLFGLNTLSGNIPIAHGPLPSMFDAGSLVAPGYNAVFGSAAANNYTGSANGAGVIMTPATHDQNITDRYPRFVDMSMRKLVYFSREFMGKPIGHAGQWTSGATYATGDVVWDVQPSYNSFCSTGNGCNWRKTAACVGAESAATRPLTGSAWATCWEAEAVKDIEDSVLAHQTCVDFASAATCSALGATGQSMIGTANAWIRAGYRYLSTDEPTISVGGLGGSYIGAMPPIMCGFFPLPSGFSACR